MKNSVQMARQKFPQVRTDFIPFGGGLDMVTPPLFMAPSILRAAQNYECDINGGYARIVGYERSDGRPSPSAAQYGVLPVTITGAFATGDDITGVTSGATATVVAAAASSLVITKISGTFVAAETLNVAAAPQGTTTAAVTVDGASTALLHAQYKNFAADEYRSDIAAVPGSGNVLGGFKYNSVNYAFRNNAGGTAAALYKSTAGGWSAVSLGRKLLFTTGSELLTEGATLTGATSGASAVITRVMLQSGSYGGGTAVGKFIFASVTGAFQNGENLQVGGLTKAVASGADAAITLLPGGRVRAVIDNFGGQVNTNRVYGCDGVNPGFEFDGTVFCPISTGMTTDAPSHVHVHMNQLFYSFEGSVQHSAPGTPYIWSAVLGASELAMGDTITGFQSQPGSESSGALAIFTRNRLKMLYGTGVLDWTLVTYRKEIGAYADTLQDVGYTMFCDDRGITNIQTSQAYGNFSHATLSALIRPWLNTQRTKITASCVSRDKNQYRLFFNDQYALFITLKGRQVVGMMPIFLGNEARCAWSQEESDGSETIYFGSSNGMVYQMERGTSFDGAEIESYLHLAFNFTRSPRILKDYLRCALEVTGTGYSAWTFSYSLGYGSSQIEQPSDQTTVTAFSSLHWDSGASWDSQFWDGQTLIPAELDMAGSAENMSIMLRGSSDYHDAARFSGAHVHYIPRRLLH